MYFAAKFVEREKGFEPSTSTLARWHSTTELLPQREGSDYLAALHLSTHSLPIYEKKAIAAWLTTDPSSLSTVCS